MKYDHLWNDLPDAERERLMPHMIECQILYYEQAKLKAIRAHKKLLADFNAHIQSCKGCLPK